MTTTARPRLPAQRRPRPTSPRPVYQDDEIELRFRRYQAVALRASAIDRAAGNGCAGDFGGLAAARRAWRHLYDVGLVGNRSDDLVTLTLRRTGTE